LKLRPQLLPRQPYGPDSELICQVNQYFHYNRMRVHVQVAVNVRQLETGISKPLQLGPYLKREIGPCPFAELVLQTCLYWICAEPACGIGEVRYLARGQSRPAAYKNQMKSNR